MVCFEKVADIYSLMLHSNNVAQYMGYFSKKKKKGYFYESKIKKDKGLDFQKWVPNDPFNQITL